VGVLESGKRTFSLRRNGDIRNRAQPWPGDELWETPQGPREIIEYKGGVRGIVASSTVGTQMCASSYSIAVDIRFTVLHDPDWQ
jgi:hypothetical protein